MLQISLPPGRPMDADRTIRPQKPAAVHFVTGRRSAVVLLFAHPFSVRRPISITLLLLFCLLQSAPLFALGSTPESRLPACCRMHGKHHCMMTIEAMEVLLGGNHLIPVPSKCPLFPKAVGPVPSQILYFNQAALQPVGVLTYPAQTRQTEARARVALEGARHKRGPPIVLL
jgi:hypothetical protein